MTDPAQRAETVKIVQYSAVVSIKCMSIDQMGTLGHMWLYLPVLAKTITAISGY